MAINSIYRVRSRGTLRGSRVEFGVHIRQIAGLGGASALAANWVGQMGTLVTAATSAEVNWDAVVVQDTNEAGDETVELAFTQPFPGLITGDCLPGQNAVVVSLRTGIKGRRRHGRFYLPGISESNHSNGRVTGTQLTAITALADGMLGAYGPTGSQANYRLVVYSPPSPPFVPKPPPPSHTDTLVTPITNALVDQIVRSQRRRNIGVGM